MSHNLDRPIERMEQIIAERKAEGLDVEEHLFELECLKTERSERSVSKMYESEAFAGRPEFFIEADIIFALFGQGFHEDSYGNDICPSFRKDIGDKYIKIFVDAKKEADRECSGRRFYVHLYINDEVAFHWSKDSIDQCLDIVIGIQAS